MNPYDIDPTLFLSPNERRKLLGIVVGSAWPGASIGLFGAITAFPALIAGALAGAVLGSRIAVKNLDADATKARAIAQLIPNETAKAISERIAECWRRYNKLLNGDFLPEDVERGTVQLQRCVCAEVLRILDLNGGWLPESIPLLNEYLTAYSCKQLRGQTTSEAS